MSDTLTLLPPNATATERALARVVGRTTVLSVGPKYRALWSPQTCPAGILPWLAWSLHVDEWDSNWTEQQKRDVIEASVAVHKTKGTIGALKRALAALGYEVTVDENTGEVYTFRLEFDLNQTGVLGTDTFAAARRVALANKNARSKLLAVRSSLTATAGVYGAVAHHRAQTVTVDAGAYNIPLAAILPNSVDVMLDNTLSITCAYYGATAFQWYKDAELIDGATSHIFSKTSELSDIGIYTCVVSNYAGSVTSNGCTVNVFSLPATGLLLSYLPESGITEVGGKITSWAPSAGSLTYPMVNDDEAYQPSIVTGHSLNGHDPLYINNKRLTTGYQTYIIDDAASFSFSILVKNTGSGGYDLYGVNHNTGGSASIALKIDPKRTYDFWRIASHSSNGTYTDDASSLASADSVVRLLTVVVTNSVPELYSGTTKITNDLLAGWYINYSENNMAYFYIGGSALINRSTYACYVYETAIWGRALTTEELEKFVAYINYKYNLWIV